MDWADSWASAGTITELARRDELASLAAGGSPEIDATGAVAAGAALSALAPQNSPLT
jgi:hypothetical protein